MMNDISQNVVGILPPQAKGRSDSVKQTQETPAVEAPKVTQLAREQKVEAGALQAADDKEIEEAVDDLNDFAQSVNRQLQFTVDEESGKTIVKVIDAETGETIRDIPPEEILNMQKQLRKTSEQFFHQEQEGVSLLFQGKA